jgi:hypothetical protein
MLGAGFCEAPFRAIAHASVRAPGLQRAAKFRKLASKMRVLASGESMA